MGHLLFFVRYEAHDPSCFGHSFVAFGTSQLWPHALPVQAELPVRENSAESGEGTCLAESSPKEQSFRKKIADMQDERAAVAPNVTQLDG